MHLRGLAPPPFHLPVTVRRLDLSNNKVKGVFGKSNAGQVTALTNLEELSIASNNLKGKVPQALAALKKLTKLNLSDNKFSGRIPGVVTKFSLLKYVRAALGPGTCRGYYLLRGHWHFDFRQRVCPETLPGNFARKLCQHLGNAMRVHAWTGIWTSPTTT